METGTDPTALTGARGSWPTEDSPWLGASQHARTLLDLLLRQPDDAAVAAEVEQLLGRAVTVLEDSAAKATPSPPFHEMTLPDWKRFADRSMVSGPIHPFALPLEMRLEDGKAVAPANLGLPYQGPPGRVHGGYVAVMLDHVMGFACGQLAHGQVFTRTLTVDYDAATPLLTDLTVEAEVERVDGRKFWVTGLIRTADEVTVRAHGLWLRPRS